MLPSQRTLFEIPRGVCFLNAASYSPLPLRTQEAGRAAVGRRVRPGRLTPRSPTASTSARGLRLPA
jgi:hypothetical protein